ncbi:nucleotide pyrophosphohydrolase [Candidatus Woesearchaeota archaeon]|nr:nucleotide pyrophosphohydrolase [Candidatus Woesearchaeota archaeon]
MNTLLGIYQQDVDTSLQKFTVKYWSPHEMLASLVEEVGEVSREINNQFGPKKKKPGENSGDLGGELADVMFSVICIANEQKINLDEVWARVMVKYELRDSNRFERKK